MAKDRSNFDRRLAFSPAETAALLGVSPAALDRWIKSGRVPSIKLGDRRLISRAALDALLAGTSVPLHEVSGR
jgi:excisionase family DNA binding protein